MPEKTAYHVLRLTRAKPKTIDTGSATTGGPAHDEYAVVGENIAAHSSDHAIRIYAENVANDVTTLDGGGVYVAIPSRSFKPTVVSVSTTTTVKVGAAAK